MDTKIHITCYQYRLPFKKPFITGGETYHCREGVILKLQKDGITAYGEAAPLPGFSAFKLDKVISQIYMNRTAIKNIFRCEYPQTIAENFYSEHSIIPSLCFGIDTLIYDFLSQQKQLPLADFLFDQHRSTIPINAIISSGGSPRELLKQAQFFVEEGYSTLKFKVDNSFDFQFEGLKKIRNKYPGIRLRVDANQSWSVREAINNLNRLKSIDTEYCEEPLAEFSLNALKKIYEKTSAPIALDESVNRIKNLSAFLPYISAIIIKPMVIGNFSKLFATKRLLDDHVITTVITTSLESGIGRLMTATLASGLGSSQTAHGLDTGSLLTLDVWKDGTYINNGRFSMPDSIGMGKTGQPDLKSVTVKKFKL